MEKRAKVISIVNQKGGIAKTTTALNFAEELSRAGYKVLAVDFDPQGNFTFASNIANGANIDDLEYTIANCLQADMDGEKDISLPIYTDSDYAFDVVPCNIEMAYVLQSMMLSISRENILYRVLEPVRADYDYIVIDTAPSLGIDMINALRASDEVIIASKPSAFSASGVKGLFKTITNVRERINPNLKVSGILITLVNTRGGKRVKDIIAELHEVWGNDVYVFDTYIPQSNKVDESQEDRIPLREKDKRNIVVNAYREFTKEYLNLDL